MKNLPDWLKVVIWCLLVLPVSFSLGIAAGTVGGIWSDKVLEWLS